MNPLFIMLALMALAGIWDIYALRRYGDAAGMTVSWQLYTDSRNWPALAFLAGFGVHWVVAGNEVMAIFLLICGHIFGTMRGAS